MTKLLFTSLAICVAVSVLAHSGNNTSEVSFRDIAIASGLTGRNVYGGLDRKDYILETTGNGVAIFDYDGDGRNDIFVANGRRLDEPPKADSSPQLYHNEGKGHFKNVAAQAGFKPQGWAQAVCVGDYDNDGR